MSVSYDSAAVSSPHLPLPLDPLPQTLEELIQQKERWSPTPKAYFGDVFGRNASQSPSPSPVKRRRVGKDVRQREPDTFREAVKVKEPAEGWGLDEEVASVSMDHSRYMSGHNLGKQRIQAEPEATTSYEMDLDPMVTTGETQSIEEPDMNNGAERSPPLLDAGGGTGYEPYAVFEPRMDKQSEDTSTSAKQYQTASSLPTHVSTKRPAVPLSPKHVNVPESRPNRSFLRDEVKMTGLEVGEENVDSTRGQSQTETVAKNRVPSITKPKPSNTPDVFGGLVDGGANPRLSIPTTKTLHKTVPSHSVKATFAKPALPSHSSLRGPANASEALRNTQVDNLRHSSKKPSNPLSAKPSVFYDVPTDPSRAIKRTASVSLMDTTLSGTGRDSVIIPLRKKRRVDGSTVPVADDIGTNRGKDKTRQEQGTLSKQQPQKNAERHQLDDYKKSYTKAFPSFIFLFEIDADKAQVRTLKDQIRRLGGTTEEFLSKKVTHYITSKSISSAPTVAPMPQKAAPNPSRLALVNSSLASRRTLSSRVAAEARSLLKTTTGTNTNKESLMSPYKSPAQNQGTGNVALQAQLLGCKVWTLAKLERVLGMLIQPESHASGQGRKEDDLSALLEDERLHGTRERDFLAKRPDWHYFQEDSHYLLVEDALGEYRALLTKVYDKPTTGQQAPAWPVLYNTFLKPSRDVLNRVSTTKPEQLRERAIMLWVKREPYGDEKPPPLKSTSTLFENALANKPVTRSASMNNIAASDIPRYHREDSMTPYAAASGNSVVLTSNIASTTSQRHSHNPDMSLHGIPDYGKDKRIVQMNRRVQLLKGKASAQMAEQKQLEARKVLAVQNMTYGEELQGDETMDGESSFIEDRSSSRRSRQDSFTVGSSISTSFPRAASSLDVFGDGNSHRSMDETVRAKVLEILEESRKPCELSLLQIMKLKKASKRKHEIPRFDLDGSAKSGYCENCRTKYESFEEHCESRRHRKFAENPENFATLDQLLHTIRRPACGATYIDYSTFPPPRCPYEVFESGGYEDDFGDLEGVSEVEWEIFKDYCARQASMEQRAGEDA